jgi:tRNA(adenine34) deaminase
MSVIINRALGYRWAFRASVNESSPESTDLKMMARCLELARTATRAGEFPFAAVISKDREVVAEAINQVAHDADITRHAELIAVSAGQKVLGRGNLKNCTLYTIIEPCPMCSFAIREARIGRVVFALSSPLMGGWSRWNVLGDDVLSSHMPEVFAPPPEVLAGLLSKEAAQVWRRWNPIIWGIIRLRGVFRSSSARASDGLAPPRMPRCATTRGVLTYPENEKNPPR